MAPPRTVDIHSLPEYAQFIDSFRKPGTGPVWFRGVGSASGHKLIPSLYRHPSKTNINDLVELEANLLTRFRHRSIPYQDRPTNEAWELLFMMQHYGVPTRLLDWSENPYIALYFAIVSAEARMQRGAFTEDAAVWLLNTQLWNGKLQLGPYWNGRVLAVPDPPLDGYKPEANLARLAANPIAMAGFHNSPRIVAQRGAFTIFGHVNEPMETIYDTQNFPADALIKMVLPTADLAVLREALFGIGYADSMIYPDLTGLAKEIKRHFGFEV